MKVTVIGTGMVGSTFAYRLMVSGEASEIVLIDVNNERALGEAEDILNAVPAEHPTRVSAGSYSEAAGSDFVVITAGLSNLKDGTRLDLCAKNAAIFKDIVPQVVAQAPHAIYLVASNPMDVMTYATIRYSGLDPARVIGSGTVLDSNRFRAYLAERLAVAPQAITAYSLGEHGDSQVPIFSQVKVGGIQLESYLSQTGKSLSEDDRTALTEQVRTAAYRIIGRKNATYYGIASALYRILHAVWHDEHVVLPVSTLTRGEYETSDICLALPTMVSRKGAGQILDISLSQEEFSGLRHSAEVLGEYTRSLPS